MSDKRETRLLVIAPTSELTPDQLARHLHSLELSLTIKETCYGALVEGRPENVHRAVAEAKELDPNRIFSKIRGFPIGDERRCRAHHGSRPGFSQLQQEWKDLSMVEKGLECAERGEKLEEVEKPRKLPVAELKRICEEVE
jgi:putative methanogenesis marker protein 6